MNRKILILLIIISFFATIGVGGYAYVAGLFDDEESEVGSELSEVPSQTYVSEVKSQTEGVDTQVPSEATNGSLTSDPKKEDDDEYDENGDLRSESKYLDDDGDTVANYYDICPDVDDFSSDCDTDAYSNSNSTSSNSNLDKNGDPRSQSKYLDEDGDTVANYYDICPGIDDFSDACTN